MLDAGYWMLGSAGVVVMAAGRGIAFNIQRPTVI
jgi:hypothetical protein